MGRTYSSIDITMEWETSICHEFELFYRAIIAHFDCKPVPARHDGMEGEGRARESCEGCRSGFEVMW
jgi:hypothetical protein